MRNKTIHVRVKVTLRKIEPLNTAQQNPKRAWHGGLRPGRIVNHYRYDVGPMSGLACLVESVLNLVHDEL